MTVLTAMGGLLTRHQDGWRWRDGRAEPRVRDLTAAEAFPFPRVTEVDPGAPEGRVRYINVPWRIVREEPDLAEVISLAGPRALRPAGEPVVQIPEDIWDPWVHNRVIGVLWDADDEDDLLSTAESLRTSSLE